MLGAFHLFAEIILGAGASVSGKPRGSERSWNKIQYKRNEGRIDRMERNQTSVCLRFLGEGEWGNCLCFPCVCILVS